MTTRHATGSHFSQALKGLMTGSIVFLILSLLLPPLADFSPESSGRHLHGLSLNQECKHEPDLHYSASGSYLQVLSDHDVPAMPPRDASLPVKQDSEEKPVEKDADGSKKSTTHGHLACALQASTVTAERQEKQAAFHRKSPDLVVLLHAWKGYIA